MNTTSLGSRGRSPRRIVALGVLACVLVLVAACGGEPKPAKQPSSSPSATRSASPEAFGVPEVGTCHQLSFKQLDLPDLQGPEVDCADPHTGQVVATAQLPEGLTPSSSFEKIGEFARPACQEGAVEAVGGTVEERRNSLFETYFFLPSRQQAARGARWVSCELIAPTATKALPLPAATPAIGDSGLEDRYQECRQLIKSELVSCAEKHVLRATQSYEVPATAKPGGKQYLARCKRSFPKERMVAQVGPRYSTLEPDVQLVNCLAFDLDE